MPAYYNENDPKAAAWLRELIKHGHIADGDVDERSIVDVRPDELAGFTQCHFFAGIGGWSYALRLAGWPDDKPVWTGSCPCQPFSSAGKGAGTADARHLWPEFHRLISKCRPTTVFGEQVASRAGRDWLATVRADLEALGYAVGAADLCAASVGAPHIRQRLWFVADSLSAGWPEGRAEPGIGQATGRSEPRNVGDAINRGLERLARTGDDRNEPGRINAHQTRPATASGRGGSMADSAGAGSLPIAFPGVHSGEESPGAWNGEPERYGAVSLMADAQHDDRRADLTRRESERRVLDGRSGFWTPADWLPCRDGKARPVESGTFPLAYGIPARVGRLRGYGNAIVPQVAAAFIRAAML